MKKLLVLSAIATLFSITSFAQKSVVDICLDKAANNMEMKMCVYDEYGRQDKKLNAEYKILVGNLKKDTSEEGIEIVNRIIKAQRAWISFRDTSCDVEGIDMLNGTGEGLIVGGCLGRLTGERVVYIMQLKKTLTSAGL